MANMYTMKKDSSNSISGSGVLVIIRHGTTNHVNLLQIIWPSQRDGKEDSRYLDFNPESNSQTIESLQIALDRAGSGPAWFRLEMNGTAYRFQGTLTETPHDNPCTGRIRILDHIKIVDDCEMLEEVAQFNQLALEDKIWRYMTMAQFCNLGLTGNLHMQSIAATMLEDPYEGLLPKAFAEVLEPSLPYDPWPWLTSSWCLSEYNNFALWEIYGDRQGVAIQTTVGKLKNRLDMGAWEDSYHLFRIAYLDYSEGATMPSDWPQGTWLQDERLPYLCKRHEFKHEQEVRLLCKMWDDTMVEWREKESVRPVNPDNIILQVPVNPNVLVDKVYAHPKSKRWVRETIRKLMDQWKWNAEFIGNSEPRREVPSFVPKQP